MTITWICRFHPFDSWHEVGCPHMEWTKEQLQKALETSKRSHAMLLERYISSLPTTALEDIESCFREST